MANDPTGIFFKRLYNLKLLFYKKIFTPAARADCFLKGISLGAGVSFYGRTYFYRRPFSKIFIGDNCGFRSRFHSNLIGINRPCSVSTLDYGAEITIGTRCGFSGTVIGAARRIQIGNNVRCGANTLITDNDWHLDDPRAGAPEAVTIEDNVWIGEGAKILKGVCVGHNSIIGGGSVVTSNILPNVIAAGNPCRVIRDL